jgi:acetylornithine deacetylase
MVGEPTDNCLVSECKGTKAFTITLPGKPCHSGYPEKGVSAVERFVEFMNLLKIADFPKDRVLGDTTWNVGMLKSGNPRNILSPEITFDIYFRTTFATDDLVHNKLLGICGAGAVIRAFGGDSPMCFFSDVEGIPVKTASFGSDAPHLAGFRRKAVCGPGSILTAHTPDEHVLLSDLEKAVEQDIAIYKEATGKNRLA